MWNKTHLIHQNLLTIPFTTVLYNLVRWGIFGTFLSGNEFEEFHTNGTFYKKIDDFGH